MNRATFDASHRDLKPPAREAAFGLSRPAKFLKYLEARAIFETLLLGPCAPLLALRPRGDGRKIMLLPGFLTDDRSTWPLRQYLRFLGYDALPWDMGRNNGFPERDAARLAKRLDDSLASDSTITLIGWSLGGVIARETARLRPSRIREVITLGTPVEGGPKYTIAGQRFAQINDIDLESFEIHVHEVNKSGLQQPITAIYSCSDGIVGWRAAIDRYNAQTRHVRLPASHLGLGTHPLVWHTIERTLRASS